MVAAGLCASKGEGRRLVQQGGVALDGERVENPQQTVTDERLREGVVFKKGKKIYQRVILK